MLNEWLPKDCIKTFAWEGINGKSLHINVQTSTEDNWETTVVHGVDLSTGMIYVLHVGERHVNNGFLYKT